MSDQSDVRVKLDDRIRLMSALLAATDWPEKSQERKPHGTHAHARATHKFLNAHLAHPAVQALQNLLDQGAPLEAMFTFSQYFSWPELTVDDLPRWIPPDWDKQIADFCAAANLESWWQKEQDQWDQGVNESKNVFKTVQFKDFLKPFLGDIQEEFVFVPNICYPADQEIGIRMDNELLCITPPPLAWGDSPPWPYDEETMLTHSYRASLTQFARVLLMNYLRQHPDKVIEVQKTDLPVSDQFRALHPTWEEQFISLFVAAAVAMYLEDYVSESEAKAYVLLERKARGMQILPGTVSVLRRYLQELGNKYETLLDFLPIFPKQLRVAKKIVTL